MYLNEKTLESPLWDYDQDPENCHACLHVDDICPYHRGVEDAYAATAQEEGSMTTTWVSPGEDAITASHTAHTAWANGTGWRVSWLGRELDRNQAITAMQIANRIAALDGEPGQDDLALLDTWARELDLTASEVITAVRSTTP